MTARVLLRLLIRHVPAAFASFLAMHQEIRDANTHSQLQDDLVKNLWMLKRKQRLVLFVIYLFEFYLFGFQTIYYLYV
jgi:hypothetical protein